VRLKVVLDSDGLIKLAKSGILAQVIREWHCLVPQAVYEETVERGKQEAYPDAEEIERLVHGHVKPLRENEQAEAILVQARALGRGEQEALHLFFNERADVIITDDRAFLAVLKRAGLPALPPALALVELARFGGIQLAEAESALEMMKGLIRQEVYQLARRDLEELRKRTKLKGAEMDEGERQS